MTSVEPAFAPPHSRSVGASTVLLSTALVDVYVNEYKHSTVRCMIDTGSQATFVTEACAQRLGLSRRHVNVPIFGIENKPVQPKGLVSFAISLRNNTEPRIPISALILPKLISQMPSVPLPHTGWSHIQNLNLADPTFHTPQPVEMLLGADILSYILLSGVITGIPRSPIAMNSVFGYLLLGNVNLGITSQDSKDESTSLIPLRVCFSSFEKDMDLQRFWELESLPEVRKLTQDELICEDFFEKTHTRDESGRYIVALPFKPDAPTPPLGESRNIAFSRFRKLEHRLESNPKLKADYHECLQEYVDLGHMEPVTDRQHKSLDTCTHPYYIPHHAVIKESSETSRTRVVFDAGCKTSNNHSLNDVLLTGPRLHRDIVDVLLKFRIHPIAFTADIKQMYRNILVRDCDRDFQRILWRTSPEKPLRDYRLNTVTFAVNASPFLALRTIQQLAVDEAQKYKLGSKVMANDVFVDDVVSGEIDETRALILQQELIDICQSAGFELRKWHSNSPAILAAVQSPEGHGERSVQVPFAEMETDKRVKVLGFQWNPKSDHFTFSVQSTTDKYTKRAILSEIAKIYDPMGLLSPVTLYAKHLIQRLWIAGVEWDATPPLDIKHSWNSFTTELPLLSRVSFPRHAFPHNQVCVQIHGFSDASEIAYAACVYIRFESSDGTVRSFLLLAKTRVAPLKLRLTIPRFELMAATLLSQLIDKVMHTYGDRVNSDNVYAWSDSSIVLAWLRSPPYEWKTFVSNRTSEILSRVPSACWRHVPSADNPADSASRGLLPNVFIHHHLWFNGPAWLSMDVQFWPKPRDVVATKEEKRNSPILSNPVASANDSMDGLFSRFSSLTKLVRVTALIFRFYKKCRKLQSKFQAHVTVSEYNNSLKRLVKIVQHSTFKTTFTTFLQEDRHQIHCADSTHF